LHNFESRLFVNILLKFEMKETNLNTKEISTNLVTF